MGRVPSLCERFPRGQAQDYPVKEEMHLLLFLLTLAHGSTKAFRELVTTMPLIACLSCIKSRKVEKTDTLSFLIDRECMPHVKKKKQDFVVLLQYC